MLKCTGFAFVFAMITCEPAELPTGKASFCDVMNQNGGKITLSRKDTRETKEQADARNAAYDSQRCGKK